MYTHIYTYTLKSGVFEFYLGRLSPLNLQIALKSEFHVVYCLPRKIF